MDRLLRLKYEKLIKFLNRLDNCIIAFSGGVDSGLLVRISYECLEERAVAVTAVSESYPKEDLLFAKRFTKKIGIKHLIIKTDEFKDKNFIKNSKLRCYYCKSALFSKLLEITEKYGFKNIIDGTNYEDRKDSRFGLLANKRFKVISPLYECRFVKKDIRDLAKFLGLEFWNKPANSCFSSRIPFGEPITTERIRRVIKAEKILKRFFNEEILIRARDHKDILRIEFQKEKLKKMINFNIDKIINKLKAIGYTYITVDLDGYIPAGLRKINI